MLVRNNPLARLNRWFPAHIFFQVQKLQGFFWQIICQKKKKQELLAQTDENIVFEKATDAVIKSKGNMQFLSPLVGLSV